MTLILACASPEGLILASDTMLVRGSSADEIETKWCKVGPWHIGVSGALAYLQAVRFGLAPGPGDDIGSLVAWLRKLFAAHQCAQDRSTNGVFEYECSLLVAREKRVWHVDCSLYAMEIKTGEWAASGDGAAMAEGILDGLSAANSPFSPSETARLTLELAEKRCAHVRGCNVRVIPYGAPEASYQVRPGARPQMEIPD